MTYGYSAVYYQGQALDALYSGDVQLFPSINYFRFQNRTSSMATITLTKGGSGSNTLYLSTSTNGIDWTDHAISATTTFTLPANGYLLFDGTANGGTFSTINAWWSFRSNYNVDVLGDISTLGGDDGNSVAELEYYNLFSHNTKLINANNLILPATTLAYNCYLSMFDSCTSLVNAPALPATTLANSCYYYMFNGCTSLVNAPELPATTLAVLCYSNMFYGCTSLVASPILSAPTLVNYCYESMFKNCSSLTSITCLAVNDDSDIGSTVGWVDGVNSEGVFYCDSTMTSAWHTYEESRNRCYPINFTLQAYN